MTLKRGYLPLYREDNGFDPTRIRPMTDQAQLADSYLDWLRDSRRSSPETIRGYASVLNAWVRHTGGEVLSQARSEMEAFTQRPKSDGTDRSANSQRRDVAVLRGFYKWAHDEGHTPRHLAGNLSRPKVPDARPKPIPDDVWQDVWRTDMAPLLRVTLGIGYYAGLRRMEISNLCGNQVSDSHVNDFVRKGGSLHSVPWVTMVEAARTRLSAVHRNKWTDLFADELMDIAATTGPHPLLSPWTPHPSPQTVNRRMADLPFTPHQLRHSCATNLVRAGVQIHVVQNLLHHRSIQTTLGYVKLGGNELAEWLDAN